MTDAREEARQHAEGIWQTFSMPSVTDRTLENKARFIEYVANVLFIFAAQEIEAALKDQSRAIVHEWNQQLTGARLAIAEAALEMMDTITRDKAKEIERLEELQSCVTHGLNLVWCVQCVEEERLKESK